MTAAYSMEDKNNKRMRFLGLLYQRDKLIPRLPIDGKTADIIQIDPAHGIQFLIGATRSHKILPDAIIEKRIPDLSFPTGISKGAFGLSVDGIEQCIGDPDLVLCPRYRIFAKITIWDDPTAPSWNRTITRMCERMITQLMPLPRCSPPFPHTFFDHRRTTDKVESSLQANR